MSSSSASSSSPSLPLTTRVLSLLSRLFSHLQSLYLSGSRSSWLLRALSFLTITFFICRKLYHRYVHKYSGYDHATTQVKHHPHPHPPASLPSSSSPSPSSSPSSSYPSSSSSSPSSSPLHHSYDYIIVGAGSAGAVLASRLSEDSSLCILLLEAGGSDDQLYINIPAAAGKMQLGASDWCYKTQPQSPRSHLAYNHSVGHWPRGKVLGGSSSLNYMLFVRGLKRDYDAWKEEEGCEGWSWEECLPYFKKLEHVKPGAVPASPTRGEHGPMHCTVLDEVNPTAQAFIASCQKLGLPYNPDYNTGDATGASNIQINTNRGLRWNTASGYLVPLLGRKNVDVATYAHVTKVVFNEKKEAVGVTYKRGSSPSALAASPLYFVSCRREVLLCGGAINSPQLLLLSGIGPSSHLQAKGIPVVADVKGVGRNLQDHLCLPMIWKSKVATLHEDDEYSVKNYGEFLTKGTGLLTKVAVEAFAFVDTRSPYSPSAPTLPPFLSHPQPDIQFHFISATIHAEYLRNFNIASHLATAYIQKYAGTGKFTFAIGPTLLRPKSKGWIELASADPLQHPVIEPNYLSADEDVDTLISAFRLAFHIVSQPPLSSLAGEFLSGLFIESTHGPFSPSKLSDRSYCEQYVRALAGTLYHPTSTCKMGRVETDEMAVVDEQCRVRGVSGVRVVDASVMPFVVSGNTNVPVIMIAEKVSDMIKKGGGGGGKTVGQKVVEKVEKAVEKVERGVEKVKAKL